MYELYARRYHSTGEPLGNTLTVAVDQLRLNGSSTAVAFASNGNFVVTHSIGEVYAHLFDAAPPVPVEPMTVGNAASRTLSFSEPLAASGAGSVTSIANWRLSDADGRDITNRISGITQTVDSATLRAKVHIEFNGPLPPGNYRLRAQREKP